MQKLYENFYIFHFQKIIVFAETIRRNYSWKYGMLYDNVDRGKKNLSHSSGKYLMITFYSCIETTKTLKK